MRRAAAVAPLAGLLLILAGCAPTLTMQTVTEIHADGSAARAVLFSARPHEKLAGQRVQLAQHLDLPDAGEYDRHDVYTDKAAYQGTFDTVEAIPQDFRKRTPSSDKIASNRILYRSLDLVLVEVIDYEEIYPDIVRRSEGEEAVRDLVRFALDTTLQCLHGYLDDDYDITGLDRYLRARIPEILERLYGIAWEIRRARRTGLSRPSEDEEWRARLRLEAARLGLPLRQDDLPGGFKIRRQAMIEFLEGKFGELVEPRHADVPPLTWTMLSSDEAKASYTLTLETLHGSLPAFLTKLEHRLPAALGAYLPGELALSPWNPRMAFHARLRLPGTVLHTNGLRDLDGTIHWDFTGRDVALSGYSLWARALIVREEAVRALGLEAFPGSILAVDRLYQELSRGGGLHDGPLAETLREAVETGTLEPLERLAGTAPQPASAEGGGAAPPEVREGAEQLLELLRSFRTGGNGASGLAGPARSSPIGQPAEIPGSGPARVRRAPAPERDLSPQARRGGIPEIGGARPPDSPEAVPAPLPGPEIRLPGSAAPEPPEPPLLTGDATDGRAPAESEEAAADADSATTATDPGEAEAPVLERQPIPPLPGDPELGSDF